MGGGGEGYAPRAYLFQDSNGLTFARKFVVFLSVTTLQSDVFLTAVDHSCNGTEPFEMAPRS